MERKENKRRNTFEIDEIESMREKRIKGRRKEKRRGRKPMKQNTTTF